MKLALQTETIHKNKMYQILTGDPISIPPLLTYEGYSSHSPLPLSKPEISFTKD